MALGFVSLLMDVSSELVHSLLPVFLAAVLGASMTTIGLIERYWLIVLIGAVLTLARFSEAFLLLRARDVGVSATWTPGVLVTMNVVYAVSAYPAGLAADRLPDRFLFALGLAVLVVADVGLATAWNAAVVFAGVALWGLHMGLTQAMLATLVAATVPSHLRGTGFGVFDLVTGVFLLPASLLAGFLWSHFGPAATFLAGAFFTPMALIGLLRFYPDGHGVDREATD